MTIPSNILELNNWTLSDAKKIPYSPQYLFANPPVYGWKETDNIPLKTYDEVMQFQKMHTHASPTLWLEKNQPFIIVDVEPKGMAIENNPWLNQPYIYKEYSTNGGLHGILPFHPADEFSYLKDVQKIKMKQFETEVLIHHSFCRFTLNEIQINDLSYNKTISQSNEYQRNLCQSLASFKPKSSVMTTVETLHIDTTKSENLSENDLFIYKCILKRTGRPNYDVTNPKLDLSSQESKWMVKITGEALRQQPKLANQHDRLKRIVKAVATDIIPKREKHDRLFNHHQYGRVTYLDYTILSAITYVISSKNKFKR